MATSLVLRLAGPLQSWGGYSLFNRRGTLSEPTKSAIIGLLAATQGRRRTDGIEDLLGLQIAVRTEQSGTLLRDYHTMSDYRGRPLLKAEVNAKGEQKSTSYYTKPTERFYLQDAVFIVTISGPDGILRGLRDAILCPVFAPVLGRRSCIPTQPLLLGLEDGDALSVLRWLPWEASTSHKQTQQKLHNPPTSINLLVTADDPVGNDIRTDLPSSFDSLTKTFSTRRVQQEWVRVSTGLTGNSESTQVHDPFALLGW